jgi:redox-sensitive bicupin YhaK (pirin superfamily)
MPVRAIRRVITAHQQLEGAGFVVRRPLPSVGLEVADPFLLIDELGPVVLRPGEAKGAPDHPHRGFETVGYLLDGEVEHEDSSGHKGLLRAGDVQWMTAGAGVVHSEMPSRRLREEGGRMHGFQIWVNLPARLKMSPPRWQEVRAAQIPFATTPDSFADVRVIAGEALGVRAAIDTHTPVVFQHWTLRPGAAVELPLAAEFEPMVYVFEGEASVAGQTLRSGQLALLAAGDAVALGNTGSHAADLLLLAGVPIGEPVARYGPFVMNTHAELVQAFHDYQTGKFGRIERRL